MNRWRIGHAIASGLVAVAILTVGNIVYTNYAVHDGIRRNNEITCPLYSILDRPVATSDSKDVVRVRVAIHNARVKYNCPPPLISPTTTTRSTHGSR